MQGDIELLFTVEGGDSSELSAGSGYEIKKQLESIVDNINKNPFRIKFLADETSLKTIKEELKKIQDGLDKVGLKNDVSSSLQKMAKSVTEFGTKGASNIQAITDSLSELLAVVREINNKDFSLSNIIQLSGGSDVQQLRLMRDEAKSLITTIKEVQNIFANADISSKTWARLSGAMRQAYTVVNFDTASGRHSLDALSTMVRGKSVENIESAISTLKEYLNVYQQVHAALVDKGIELPLINTEEYNKAHIATEQYIADRQKLTETINDSLINESRTSSSANTYVDRVTEDVQPIISTLDDIRARIESTFDLATVDMHVDSITSQLSGIVNSIDVAADVVDKYKQASKSLNVVVDSDSLEKTTRLQEVQSDDLDHIRNAKNAIREYYDLLLKVAKAGENITFDPSHGSYAAAKAGYEGLAQEMNKATTAFHLYTSEENKSNLSAEQRVRITEAQIAAEKKYNIAYEELMRKQEEQTQKSDLAEYYDQLSEAIKRYNAQMQEAVKNQNVHGPEKNNPLGTWTAGENATANDKLLVDDLNAQAEAIRNITGAKQDDAKTTQVLSDLETHYKDTVEKTDRAQEQRAAKSKEAQVANEKAARSLADYEKIIRQYSKAETSRYTDSREAYSKLQEAANKLNTAYANGKGDTEAIKKAQEEYNRVLQESRAVFIRNGDDAKTMGDRIKDAARNLGIYISTAMLMRTALRYFKQMVSNAIELDSAFAQLRIITHATDAEMAQFASTSATLAQNLGKSIIDVTKSIEVFSRLGYNLQDASKLAEYATILSNVADVDASAATTGLTSIIKGFNLNVEDAGHIADVLVEVGQKYAVSAAEMMEAYEKSGAALNATNTSLEKSAGLIAAANASVQNASTVGEVLPMHAVMRV